MIHLTESINTILQEGTAKNLIVRVGVGDEILMDVRRTNEARVLTEQTLFDMASVTKIVATTSLALIAIDRGLISSDAPVSRFFAVPQEKNELTVRHLMTHTIGIGHKSMLEWKHGYPTIQDYILSIPADIPIGSNVRYSCPGFILLGRILEQVFGDSLDRLTRQYVTSPLRMTSTTFLPDRDLDIVNANPTPDGCGIVNDYNCRHLGGVCGNAGLFSNLADMTRFVRAMLMRGEPLFSREVYDAAAQNLTPGMSESRGLGYLYVDGRYYQTGNLFPDGSVGHCGHTGQSVFWNADSGLYVIVLSDATATVGKKYGSGSYERVKRMRERIHAAIREDLLNTRSGLVRK